MTTKTHPSRLRWTIHPQTKCIRPCPSCRPGLRRIVQDTMSIHCQPLTIVPECQARA